MEKVIWIIDNDRDEILDLQRKINSFGSMRALCMLSVDALKRTIDERLDFGANSLSAPSLILVDSKMLDENTGVTSLLKEHPKLAGVPLFFITDNDSKEAEEYYSQGAMVVLKKPVAHSGVIRIERAAWQYETTRNYERILQKQVSELESAKEIHRLNTQLEHRNAFLYKVFGQYFSDDIIEVILENPKGAYVGGERQELAVMMADLRGFSSFAEGMQADCITDVLNCYFGTMVEIISRYGGTVIELMGDGILAVFGAPVRNAYYCDNAVAAAICMQNEMAKVNDYCTDKGYDLLEMGIGIHCGETFVGNVGTERMMRYNVIGRTVNECARIEGCSVGGQILVSGKVIENVSCDTYVIDMAQILAKGIREPIAIYEIKGIGGKYKLFPQAESGYDMCSPTQAFYFRLYPINNKIVSDKPYLAQIKEFSTRNCVVAVSAGAGEIELFSDFEVRKDAEVNLSGFSGVYAKVMRAEDELISLRFTHVNREFRKFADGIQGKSFDGKGVIMGINEISKITLAELTLEDINNISTGAESVKGCILYWAKDGDDIRIVFTSTDKSVRALEFMDYLVAEYAMINGNDKIAKGVLAKAFLAVLMSELEVTNVQDFLNKKIDLYYKECQWIYGDEYLNQNEEMILNLPRYVKKPLAWAYVKTNDIVKPGEKFRLKSLENESDIIITASENVYVMIGCRGEVYCIEREKFEKTYEISDEKLDIFKQMLDYLPEVRRFSDDEFISLDVAAHLCYPKVQGGIYVTQLDRRTKVFTSHNKGEYFVGRPGDFLAIRTDDLTDMYIIQQEIFYQTYEPA